VRDTSEQGILFSRFRSSVSSLTTGLSIARVFLQAARSSPRLDRLAVLAGVRSPVEPLSFWFFFLLASRARPASCYLSAPDFCLFRFDSAVRIFLRWCSARSSLWTASFGFPVSVGRDQVPIRLAKEFFCRYCC
jgi:hypothetical protein